MCAIAAIFTALGTRIPLASKRITLMTQAQAHRGPDGAGTWVDDVAALGHCRLRVVDLSPLADQPFRDAAPTSPVLSYNGELYNADELRRELSLHGATFRTTSDTEVLYRALQRWNESVLDHIHGMFAFVYYDPKCAKVLFARDRMGIKPLVMAKCAGITLFASECAGLLASGLIDPALDPHAVYQIARFNHVLGQRTALAAASNLAPGTLYRLDLATNQLNAVHTLPLALVPDSALSARSFAARARTLDAHYTRAVKQHLRADIPVGVYLSGGVDSSGLAAEVAKHQPLTTYSLVFPRAECDESASIAQSMPTLAGTNHQVSISAICFDDYLRYVHHAEMPQLWTTDLALMKLARRARAGGHRVVLSGEGPDELFAGYDAYRWMTLRRRMPRAVKSLLQHSGGFATKRLLGNWFSSDTSLLRFYLEEHARAERDGVEARYGFYPENLASWQFVPRLAGAVFGSAFDTGEYEDEVAGVLRSVMGGQAHSVQSANVLFDLAVRMPNWVLHMSDRMSAAEGVELRVPYLDDALVAYALTLPDTDRVRGLQGKRILRQMHKYRLPRRVRMRKKVPLYTPITEWISSFFDDPRFTHYVQQASPFFARTAVDDLVTAVRTRKFASMADKLAKEWALLLVLSTNILSERWQQLAHSAQEATRETAE
jgi:asparagine synthase (glutamine-hydrolysing)